MKGSTLFRIVALAGLLYAAMMAHEARQLSAAALDAATQARDDAEEAKATAEEAKEAADEAKSTAEEAGLNRLLR